MRIIIDTNIFIPLEDTGVDFNQKYSELTKLVSGKHELLIHPESKNDINRDSNTQRRASMLQRIDKYKLLEEPPVFLEGEEQGLFGKPSKDNDAVDNLILLAIMRNCAHLLITEDAKLINKAKAKGVGDSVLTVQQACSFIGSQDTRVSADLVNIQDVSCHTISVNDRIFDSLRAGYAGFNSWYEKSTRDGRRAWICGSINDIHAICIYKDEENEIVTIDNIALPGKILKLCTLKVDRNGLKLGELLIKQAFDYADANNKSFVYVTVDDDSHRYLVDLITDFGFYYFGIDNKGRDSVYVKEFLGARGVFPSPCNVTSPLEFVVKYYPAVDARMVNVYLVPIQPQYHDRLFPDLLIQATIFSSHEDSVGNAIKQAYICRTNTKSVKPGDLVFFYRTSDQKSITSYGVVERFIIQQDSETVYSLVKRRTVYSLKDIEKMNFDLEAKAILFRRVRHLETPISFTRLKELGIVSGAIQSLLQLDESKIKLLISEANIHDCFLPD